jgi:2-dehydro-3-deoxyphosphogluconate aldolase/(4S)-4-hydroxy-2-oxoglutarate aldolase
MPKHPRHQVIHTIKEMGFIPVFYHPDPDITFSIIQACYEGGARTFEFTNRGDFAHEVFGTIMKRVRSNYPDLLLGAGSVIDAPTAAMYMQIGAEFIVSPLLDENTARVCNRRKVLWIPGCGSVTEIGLAEELGADIVKIFPGGAVGGPAFVKAVLGPMPWSSIMPTSGVEPTEDSVKKWFEAGVCCVGLGSQLFSNEWIKNGELHLISENIKRVLLWIRQYKR